MAPKAKEIAEKLGISQATLSLVVNNKPGISEQTRRRVIGQLIEGGYDYLIDDELAKLDMSGNTKNIGFIIYRKGGELLGYNSFFPLIIDGLESRAREYGYNLSYINISKESIDKEIRYINEADCSGYVIFATEMKEDDMAPFLKIGIPFVLLDNHFNTQSCNVVKVNNEQGTFLAVEHLIHMGHEKIGYLRSGLDINSFHERCTDAIKAMREMGVREPERYIYEIGYPSENAYDGMKSLISQNIEMPTAFLADNDLVTVGAMKALKESGYKIPDDISFVGFDDRPICTLIEPEVSTIRIPREVFGAEAVELIIRMLNGDINARVKVEVNSDLIVRGSVKKMK